MFIYFIYRRGKRCEFSPWVRKKEEEEEEEKERATHSSILAWENPVDRGAWWATVHGVTKNQM